MREGIVMVAYSFRPRFVDPILWGRKDQTIRAPRRNGHAAPSDKLQLYTGMRTKSCHLILRSTCIVSVPVTLQWHPDIKIIINEWSLPSSGFGVFAHRDGFADIHAMKQFWADEHPGEERFTGTLIRWQPPCAPVEIGSTVEARA